MRDDVEENATASGLNLTPPDPLGDERLASAAFARNHAVRKYRAVLDRLHAQWEVFNDRFFAGALLVPHIGIGLTPARRLSHCARTTNNGGAIAITLSERAVFGTDPRLVRDLFAKGHWAFLHDLLLGETVKQVVLEVGESDEEGYGGYGPMYALEATRIGPEIGLPEGEVMSRRRGSRGRGEPVAAFWPWAFRHEDYYLGHVNLSHLKVAGHRTSAPRNQQVASGVCDYLLYLAQTNQITRLIDVLGRQKDAETVARSPAVAAFERTPHNASGMPLPIPVIDPGWLYWNNGCVRAMAEGILTRRLFDGMPILADALQDAGCDDPVLLEHCRANCTHTANCWALALLSKPA